MTTIISDIKERTVVKFAQINGCQRCKFLDLAINNSAHKEEIHAIYLEDHTADDFHTLGIMGTPVMAIVENGEIVKRDNQVVTGEQLEAFLA